MQPTPLIAFDFDETLGHTRQPDKAPVELAMLFKDGQGCNPLELRRRFDRVVEDRLGDMTDVPFPERYHHIRQTEAHVVRDLMQERGWLPIESDHPALAGTMLSMRPGLRELLDVLRHKADLCVCTSAGELYAEACLEAAGIRDQFSEVYCAGHMADENRTLASLRPLLIDNLTVEDLMIRWKLRFLGVSAAMDLESGTDHLKKHHLEVPAFTGPGTSANWIDFLPAIQGKLDALRSSPAYSSDRM